MLRPEGEGLRVYLHREPVDMRLQRTGLASRVQAVIGEDPFSSGAIFAFIGKRYDRIKLLAWDRNGFVLWYKVIESREKFVWPREADEEVVTLTAEQLNWLLDGYDVFRQPHRLLQLAYVG
ncbi:MAG: IS66 family insertion sequence element accessory protein TnpB [Gammaproteobacteria bacterium]